MELSKQRVSRVSKSPKVHSVAEVISVDVNLLHLSVNKTMTFHSGNSSVEETMRRAIKRRKMEVGDSFGQNISEEFW